LTGRKKVQGRGEVYRWKYSRCKDRAKFVNRLEEEDFRVPGRGGGGIFRTAP